MTAAAPGGPPRRFAPGPVDTVVGRHVVRFDAAERFVHWATSAAVLVAATTGAVLYVDPLAEAVGRRGLVKDVHVVAGIATVVPFATVLVAGRAAGLRRDIHRFANWHRDDVRWFRRRDRRRAETGKFNGGQKANAVYVAGVLLVMLATGSIMRWFGPFPLTFRTGATFVHDCIAVSLWLLIPAHVVKAFATRGAVRGMVTGWTPLEQAESRPRWAAELSRDER